MDRPENNTDRRNDVPDHWIIRMYSYEGEHPCTEVCPEPCEKCLFIAHGLSWCAENLFAQNPIQRERLVGLVKDYNWENGPPAPSSPPRRVANLMPVPQPLVFTDAVSHKKIDPV